MTQGELSRILHELDCPVNEGVSSLKNTMKFPRIDYWEIVWEDIVASGEEYAEKITWQISFYARKPRDRKLLELRDALRKLGFPMNTTQKIISGILISQLKRMVVPYEQNIQWSGDRV